MIDADKQKDAAEGLESFLEVLESGHAQLRDVKAALCMFVDPNTVLDEGQSLLMHAIAHGACAGVVSVCDDGSGGGCTMRARLWWRRKGFLR